MAAIYVRCFFRVVTLGAADGQSEVPKTYKNIESKSYALDRAVCSRFIKFSKDLITELVSTGVIGNVTVLELAGY